jgi:hypothetical protein
METNPGRSARRSQPCRLSYSGSRFLAIGVQKVAHATIEKIIPYLNTELGNNEWATARNRHATFGLIVVTNGAPDVWSNSTQNFTYPSLEWISVQWRKKIASFYGHE